MADINDRNKGMRPEDEKERRDDTSPGTDESKDTDGDGRAA